MNTLQEFQNPTSVKQRLKGEGKYFWTSRENKAYAEFIEKNIDLLENSK